MNCNDFQKIIYLLKEIQLSETELNELQNHLLVCDECKKIYSQMNEINNSLKQLAEATIEIPLNISDSIIEQLENNNQTRKAMQFNLKNRKEKGIIKIIQYTITGIAASLIFFYYFLEFNDLNSIHQLEKQISEYSIQKPIQQIIHEKMHFQSKKYQINRNSKLLKAFILIK